jgi:hypothetical protein
MVAPIVSSKYRLMYQFSYVIFLVLTKLQIYYCWTALVVLEVR